jgi:hypothetical protein
MMKLIIGCDPDVDGKGFAIYEDGILVDLKSFTFIELIPFFKDDCGYEIELHIEDLNGNKSSSFNHRSRQSKAVQNKISESVGRCKQMQLEVEKIAEHFDIKIVRHKVSSKWKDAAGKKEFERVTGWTGRSNEDTRSAAYFGFLGCK